jgi:tripartite-type tricarboxylate transporter receptor subunit TctC
MIALRMLGVLALLMCAASALASEDDFYRGRDLTLVIGYEPGGGYDLYARLLARHLGDHIPGHPTIITQNMPGAGSIKAANYLYSVAPKDGSVIATFAHGIGSAPLLGEAAFDARKFTWLGSVTQDVMVCVARAGSSIKDWNDVLTRPSIFGGVAAGNAPDIYAKLYKNVFGAKIRLATGFPGSSGIALGLARGEIDGLCGIAWSTVKSQHPDWLSAHKVRVLLQAAEKKDPELSDVPLDSDFVKTADQRQILDFVKASQIMARPFAAPPAIPPARQAILRRAFDATMKDPGFLADAQKVRLDIDPVTGAEIDTLVAKLYAAPKRVIAEATKAIVH